MTIKNIDKKKLGKIIRAWGPTVLKIGVMAGVALVADPTAFATDTTTVDTAKLSKITEPLKLISETMSGPVASGITTIGAVVFGASWAANIDSQVTKGAMRVAGGSAIALGGSQIIGEVTSILF